MDMKDDIKKIMAELDSNMSNLEKEMDDIEKEGIKNTLKYFDRIHDKLYSLNNMLIVSYLVIIVIPNSNISPWLFSVPILNMLFLLYIDYRLLRRSRFQAIIKSKGISEIETQNRYMDKTNLYSLLTIWTTVIVTLVLLYQLLNLF